MAKKLYPEISRKKKMSILQRCYDEIKNPHYTRDECDARRLDNSECLRLLKMLLNGDNDDNGRIGRGRIFTHCPLSKESINDMIPVYKEKEEEEKYIPSRIPKYCSTLLYIACGYNNIEVVEFILANFDNVDVNKRTYFSKTDSKSPFICCCESGHVDLVKLLIKHGAEDSMHKIDKIIENTSISKEIRDILVNRKKSITWQEKVIMELQKKIEYLEERQHDKDTFANPIYGLNKPFSEFDRALIRLRGPEELNQRFSKIPDMPSFERKY